MLRFIGKTKDFKSLAKVIRVNKFGVHEIDKPESMDSGMGFTYCVYGTPITYPHNGCSENILTDEIREYIKDNSTTNPLKQSKLKITIVNHAYPVVQILPNSEIVIDGHVAWKYDKNNEIVTEIDRPVPNIPIELSIYNTKRSLPDMKSVKHDLGEINVAANEIVYLYYDNNVFTNMGFHFGSEEDVQNIQKLRQNRPSNSNFFFRAYSPGGKTNLGDLTDCKDFEKKFEENQKYQHELLINFYNL
jgi:hypothetical protein